jgi:drug/metabolite transporter (DMT)-like permease
VNSRVLALAGALCVSFSPLYVRLSDASPTTIAFFRAVYALPLLYLLWRVVGRSRDRRLTRHRWIALVAGFFLAADFAVWHISIDYVGAGLATALGNTHVLFVMLAGWLLLGERPSRVSFTMIPVVAVGLGLMTGLGRPGAYGEDPLRGVVLGVLTGALYTGFLLTYRRANRDTSFAAGPLLDATLGAALGAALLGIFDPGFSLIPTWPAHGWLLALAVGSQVIGWLLISHALPRLPALDTSVTLVLQPIASITWARLLFSEVFSSLQWIGLVLAFVGIGSIAAKGAAHPPPTGPQELPLG